MIGIKELNFIIKGDVDGSIEALSDALLNLSTQEIQVNIIHKGVGAISESMLIWLQFDTILGLYKTYNYKKVC